MVNSCNFTVSYLMGKSRETAYCPEKQKSATAFHTHFTAALSKLADLYMGSNSDYIVESSLGYYINPLINVLLGVCFLKERLRPIQWTALFLAFPGVYYLTFGYGHFPWIAIVLALTFGLYGGLLRKTTSLPSLEGLCLETAILFIPALVTLIFLASQGGI
jgi:chloramphenicol-sensitive protein RarD